jgi:hypothetical protein
MEYTLGPISIIALIIVIIYMIYLFLNIILDKK